MSTALSRLIRLTPSTRSDRDLLQAYVDGADPSAFDELFRRLVGLAHRAASEVCPFAAEDVAQTALALLARNAVSVAGRESAAGWVFVTARRLAFKARTAAARRSAHEAHATSPQPPADPLDSLTLREVRAVVAEELARLPDELRLPLVLCFWDGSTQSEAATRLGCSLTTLKRRLDAGRDRLAARLARRGFAGSAVLAALTAVQAGADAAIRVARSPVVGFAPLKVMSAVVVAAVVVVAGIGIGVTAPDFDSPSQPAKPVAPPGEVAKPQPAVDLYGDPLPDGAIARFGTIRLRHGGQLHSIAYSPDGKMIASGGFGSIMLWEAETGKPIASLVQRDAASAVPGKPPQPVTWRGHTFGLAFTPDGKTLVSVGSRGIDHNTGQFTFWDVSDLKGRGYTNETIYTDGLNGEALNWVRSVAVSPDGKVAAVGSDSGTLQLLNIKTHAILQSGKFEGGVSGLSFAPDGKTLAVVANWKIHLLDTTTGKSVQQFEPGNCRLVAFTKEGKSLWVTCDGSPSWIKDKQPGTISRWGLQTANQAQKFETVPGLFLAFAISPDGKSLASGGQDRGPFLWDAATGKSVELETSQRLRPWVHGLAFAPDGKTLAVADTNGRVRVWDVATRRELHRYDEHTDGILVAAVTADGKQAATAGGDGTVRIWDLVTGQLIRGWTANEAGSVLTVAYTPDGRSVLTSGYRGRVKLSDASTGKEIREYRGEKEWSWSRAALSPDGRLVATSGYDDISIRLYEMATGRLVRVLTGHSSMVMSLTFSPDSKRLISSADMHTDRGNKHCDDRSMRVWDVATGDELHKFAAGRPHGGMAVSPDGRVVATGVYLEEEKASYLRFWDMVTGKELVERRMKNLGRPAFSPDGRYLAIAEHGDIRLVEVASGQVVQAFSGPSGSVWSFTFTPEGRRLVSAHDDGTALVWDLTPRPGAVVTPSKLWDQLASDDATLARQAAWALGADPVSTVTMLGEKLKPVPKPAKMRTTAALIDDLAAADFQAREAASRELVGRVSVDATELSEALAKSPSPEARKRLADILGAAPGPWAKLDAEGLRLVRAVAVLEAIGTPEARRLLKALADGDRYALLTREALAASRRLVD